MSVKPDIQTQGERGYFETDMAAQQREQPKEGSNVNDPRPQHTQPSTPPLFSTAMAAAAADHSEAAVSGEDFEDASFFNLTPSPDKLHSAEPTSEKHTVTTKRTAATAPTKPQRFKSPAGTPKARSRQPSPAPVAGESHNKTPNRPLWGDDSRHQRLTTITTVDEVRQQLVNDANYMATLKTGIEQVFEAVCGQQNRIAATETQHEERTKLYLGQQRDFHKLKGACREHAAAVEADHALMNESLRLLRDGCNRMVQDPIGCMGPGFQNGISQALEVRMEGIAADLEKAKVFIQIHEARELEMAAYLNKMHTSDRPAEGRYITAALQHFEKQLAEVKEQAELFGTPAAASAGGMTTAERQILDDCSGRVASMVGHFESLNGKCHCGDVDAMQARMLTLEQQIRGLLQAGPPPRATMPRHCQVPSASCCTGAATFTPGAGTYLPQGSGAADAPGGDMPPTSDANSCANGGNGICHCWHVNELERRLLIIEGRPGGGGAVPRDAAGRAPFLPRNDGNPGDAPGRPAPAPGLDLLAPLKERPLGALAGDKDGKQIFDDKLMVAPNTSTTDREAASLGSPSPVGTSWGNAIPC